MILTFAIVLGVLDDVDIQFGVTILSSTKYLFLMQKNHAFSHELVVNWEVVILHLILGLDLSVHVVRCQDGTWWMRREGVVGTAIGVQLY